MGWLDLWGIYATTPLRAQTVDRQKTIIGKNDTTLLAVDGHAIAELVKHPQRLLARRAPP